MTTPLRPFIGAVLLGTLSACAPLDAPDVSRLTEPDLTRIRTSEAPPNARAGACYGRDVTPAVIETVTEQVILQPAELAADGTVLAPAIYKTETREQIAQERRELWFEIPCHLETDVAFIETLQRALQARGLLRGPVNGVYDSRTRAAVRALQKPQGLDSGILSLAAAQRLGLAKIGPPS